ncbi:MAG: enoyl-CoA hydratase/isomerase family protein [Acidobacteria bacterium]|nr:enoyl-CoA hydratase/isomerase family protein [Acidobacteriota bacterium]
MTYENLLVEREGAVAIVTLNRPDKLNALNTLTLSEIHHLMLALGADPAVGAIVLTGAGPKAFAAGADISELAVMTPAGGKEHSAAGQRAFDAIEALGTPVIAAVNGFALGGGCELAMACTLRMAADSARFGQPEINLGLTPGYAGTQRLPRLVGRGRALELLLTGDMISAQRAYDIGLVNRVVPAADLRAEALALATTLAAKAPIATRYILELVQHGAEMPLADAQHLESTLFGLVASTDDMREGTRAFLEKRAAAWKGR